MADFQKTIRREQQLVQAKDRELARAQQQLRQQVRCVVYAHVCVCVCVCVHVCVRVCVSLVRCSPDCR